MASLDPLERIRNPVDGQEPVPPGPSRSRSTARHERQRSLRRNHAVTRHRACPRRNRRNPCRNCTGLPRSPLPRRGTSSWALARVRGGGLDSAPLEAAARAGPPRAAARAMEVPPVAACRIGTNSSPGLAVGLPRPVWLPPCRGRPGVRNRARALRLARGRCRRRGPSRAAGHRWPGACRLPCSTSKLSGGAISLARLVAKSAPGSGAPRNRELSRQQRVAPLASPSAVISTMMPSGCGSRGWASLPSPAAPPALFVRAT